MQDTVLRLDKWLWFARFFKTRSAATKVISDNRFRLDGMVMTKPHRQALPGQVLTFTQGNQVRIIKIISLGSRRGPASEAALMYEDLRPVVGKSLKMEKASESKFEARSRGSGRPTKRQRRETDRLKVIANDDED